MDLKHILTTLNISQKESAEIISFFELDLLDFLRKHHILKDAPKVLPGENLISVANALKLTTPPIGRTTLHNWTKAGKITAYKVGRRVFYSKHSLLTFLTSVEKKPPKVYR